MMAIAMVAQLRKEILGTQRFRQEPAVQSSGVAIHHAGGVAVPGDKDDAAPGMGPADQPRCFNTTHFFHHDVDQQHVGPNLGGQLHGVLTAIGSDGFEAALIQDESKGVGDY